MAAEVAPEKPLVDSIRPDLKVMSGEGGVEAEEEFVSSFDGESRRIIDPTNAEDVAVEVKALRDNISLDQDAMTDPQWAAHKLSAAEWRGLLDDAVRMNLVRYEKTTREDGSETQRLVGPPEAVKVFKQAEHQYEVTKKLERTAAAAEKHGRAEEARRKIDTVTAPTDTEDFSAEDYAGAGPVVSPEGPVESPKPEVTPVSDEERARHEAGFVKDIEQAHAAALAGDGLERQIGVLEREAEAHPERTQNARLAEQLRGEADRHEQDAVTKEEQQQVKQATQFVNLSNSVHHLMALQDSSGAVPPMDGRGNPEAARGVANDLYKTLGVDLDQEPAAVSHHGNSLRGNRVLELRRVSEDPSLRGVVFVERVDASSGQLIRLDVIKAPLPEDATTKERAAWQKEVDRQLKLSRQAHEIPDQNRGGRMQTYNLDAETRAYGGEGRAYASVLRRSGMSREAAMWPNLQKKPKQSFWSWLLGT